MSYQLIGRPGVGHQGVAPLTERLEGCCPGCGSGRPCGTGAFPRPDNPIKLAVGIASLVVGYVLLKRAAAD
jgi:hypothetical protein